MTDFPIDKYLAQDYRNTLRSFDAPQNIDTKSPLIPVIDIQKGFPKPNSKQRLRYASFLSNANTTYVQLATNTNTIKNYYLGYMALNGGAVAQQYSIFDATSGNVPALSTTPTYDVGARLVWQAMAATSQTSQYQFLPLPVELQNGLRFLWNANVGAQVEFVVFWIEEII